MVCPHPPQKRLTSSLAPPAASWAVTQALLAGFGSDSRTINIFDRHTDLSHEDIGRDDIAFLAVPCYGGRVPALAAQRIAQINGNGAKAVLVCSYGNRAYEDCLVELQDVAEAAGFRAVAAVAAVSDHSIVHRYAQGRPDKDDIARLMEWQGTQESRRRKSLPCPSESSGQPSVQKGVKSDDHPQTGVRLHILRHLC